jgi:hypothetical protein
LPICKFSQNLKTLCQEILTEKIVLQLSHLAPPPLPARPIPVEKAFPLPTNRRKDRRGSSRAGPPGPHWSELEFQFIPGRHSEQTCGHLCSLRTLFIYISRMKRQRHPTMMDHLAGQAMTPATKVARLLSGRQEVMASPSRSLKGEFLTPSSSNTFSYKESPLARGCRSVGKMLRRRMRLSRKLSGGGSMVSSSNSSNSSSNSSSSSSNSNSSSSSHNSSCENGKTAASVTTTTTPPRRRSSSIFNRAELVIEQQQLENPQQPPAAHRQQDLQQLPASCGKCSATSFLISSHPPPTAPQQQTYHHSQQQFLPRALPNDNDIIRRATTMNAATTATEQQLLLLRRSRRRRTMVRTNGSLPASGRHHSCYFGGDEEIGELVLPPMLRALPVIPFWGEEEQEEKEERPVRPPRRRKEEEMRRKEEEEEEEKAMRTESLDSLIAQAQAQLQEERAASRLAWAPSVAHARRMSAAATPAGATTFAAATLVGATTFAAATPVGATTTSAADTPVGATTTAAALAKRRVSEVNQNYMMSSPGGEHSVYMSMQVMTSAKKCRSTSSKESPSVDVPASLSTHSSEYIDMAAFPLKL